MPFEYCVLIIHIFMKSPIQLSWVGTWLPCLPEVATALNRVVLKGLHYPGAFFCSGRPPCLPWVATGGYPYKNIGWRPVGRRLRAACARNFLVDVSRKGKPRSHFFLSAISHHLSATSYHLKPLENIEHMCYYMPARLYLPSAH